MALRRRVDPTSALELARFWLPRLASARRVRLDDLEDARPDPGLTGTYAWIRCGDDDDIEEVLYVGSGIVRDRLNRERKRLLAASQLDASTLAVAWLVTDGIGIARTVEDLAIGVLAPSWQRTGFGSNTPGRGRAGQAPSQWELHYG